MAGWLAAVAEVVLFTAWTLLGVTAGLVEPALTGLGEGCCATALRWLAVLGSLAGGVAPAGLGGTARLMLMGDLQAGRSPMLLEVLVLLLAWPGVTLDEGAGLVLLLANSEGAQLKMVEEAVGLLPPALGRTVEETCLRLLLTALCLLKGPLAGELKSRPGGVPGEAPNPLLRLLLLVEAEEEPLPRSAARAAFLAAVLGRAPSAAAGGPPLLSLARGEGLTPARAC